MPAAFATLDHQSPGRMIARPMPRGFGRMPGGSAVGHDIAPAGVSAGRERGALDRTRQHQRKRHDSFALHESDRQRAFAVIVDGQIIESDAVTSGRTWFAWR